MDRAVESGDLFVLHHSTPNPRCPVGKNIQPALRRVLSPAERALEGQLANVTLAEMADSVRERALAGRWGTALGPSQFSCEGNCYCIGNELRNMVVNVRVAETC